MSYITPKTTRGVQEQDVWAAADAVLLQGERPTIERVRQHMGRGSPNTVGPMLESWFGRLGQRLSAAENEAQGDALLPQVVQEAALALWQAACKQAQVAAQTALQEQHTALAQAQEALAAREARLAQGELNLQQQKQGLDAALKLAQDQQADLSERLAAMQQQLEQREAQLTAQRQEWDELQQQRDAERRQHSTALEAAAQERQRLAEQFSGNEKRWLGELDRSRQEVEKLKKQQQQAAQDAQALVAEMRSRQAQLETEALAAQSVLATTQHSLHLANERIEELKIQLQQRPLFDSPEAVKHYLQLHLAHRQHEVFAVLFLDSQHHLIAMEELFRGTLSQTSVYPREVVLRALHHHAAAVVLAHNHPSGSVEPSRADIQLTNTLKSALALVDVRVLDHLIVAQGQALSMAEQGLV